MEKAQSCDRGGWRLCGESATSQRRSNPRSQQSRSRSSLPDHYVRAWFTYRHRRSQGQTWHLQYGICHVRRHEGQNGLWSHQEHHHNLVQIFKKIWSIAYITIHYYYYYVVDSSIILLHHITTKDLRDPERIRELYSNKTMNFKADFNIIFALEIGPTYNNYFFEFEQNIVF